jgi:hypothetical protein
MVWKIGRWKDSLEQRGYESLCIENGIDCSCQGIGSKMSGEGMQDFKDIVDTFEVKR